MMQTTVKRNILSASGAPSGLRLFLFCRPGSASAATAFRFSPAPAQALCLSGFAPFSFLIGRSAFSPFHPRLLLHLDFRVCVFSLSMV